MKPSAKPYWLASEICDILGVEHLEAFSNSQVVVSQVKGEYEACDIAIITYLAKVKEKSSMFKKFEIKHVP